MAIDSKNNNRLLGAMHADIKSVKKQVDAIFHNLNAIAEIDRNQGERIAKLESDVATHRWSLRLFVAGLVGAWIKLFLK